MDDPASPDQPAHDPSEPTQYAINEVLRDTDLSEDEARELLRELERPRFVIARWKREQERADQREHYAGVRSVVTFRTPGAPVVALGKTVKQVQTQIEAAQLSSKGGQFVTLTHVLLDTPLLVALDDILFITEIDIEREDHLALLTRTFES